MKNRFARLVFDASRDPVVLEAVIAMQAKLIDELNERIAMLRGDARRQRMLLQRRIVDRVSQVFKDFLNEQR
jgi:uncharacterized coiled-coil protein SlyX